MRVTDGPVDAAAQAGLKATAGAQGYFLACLYRPTCDIAVSLEDPAATRMSARIIDKTLFAADVVRVRLRPDAAFDYRAGQFLHLFRDASTSRCYSLASVPGLDPWLELHVRRIPGGAVSDWLHSEAAPGARIGISQSTGGSFYLPGASGQGLCLIATGTGVAPLYGIARDALHQGHRGPIHLFHGSTTGAGLYLGQELRSLREAHSNFHYVPCVSGGPDSPGFESGRVHEAALTRLPDLTGWRVFLCGNPEMVATARREAYLAGAGLRDIHADPFLASGSRAEAASKPEERQQLR